MENQQGWEVAVAVYQLLAVQFIASNKAGPEEFILDFDATDHPVHGNQDAAPHAGAIVKLLVQRVRHSWPPMRIVFRGDSGFCRDQILYWWDRNEASYVVGLARNHCLLELGSERQQQAKEQFEQTAVKQRLFEGFVYQAKSWKWMRFAVHKAEHGPRGENPRFVITNIDIALEVL